MSNAHEVSKMVEIYKKLFLLLIVVTAVGICLAFLRLPLWLAVIVAFAIMAFKGKIVLDSFKHLLTGRHVLVLTFGLTIIFFATLVILPLLNHEGQIVGTQDISKELQMQEKPAEAAKNHGH
jgi:heme A synthase